MLGVGEPRPSSQSLVHRKCSREVLFGRSPIAEGCGKHAEVTAGGATAHGGRGSSHRQVSVGQQQIVEALGLIDITESAADLSKIRQCQGAFGVEREGKAAGRQILE